MTDDKQTERNTKNGQAKTLSNAQVAELFSVIKTKRHPEKNTLIMQISFKLGLRVQEIALLRIKEVVKLNESLLEGFEVKETLVLPKKFTKGANAVKRSQKLYKRTSVRFTISEFDRTVALIQKLTLAGAEVNPEDFYPDIKRNEGTSRELAIADKELIEAIEKYVIIRLHNNPLLKSSDPLIVNQKGGPYSPNSLQDHMGLMLKKWAGIERGSSHSGRRTFATIMLTKNDEPLKVVQKILGHKDGATTLIYQDVPDEQLVDVIKTAGKSYKNKY